MWKYGWVLLVAVAGSGCVHRFECTVHGGRVVRQVETEHFVVTSDLDEDVLVKQASELEQLWQAWVVFFGHQPATSARLSVVLSSGGATAEFIEGAAGFVHYGAVPVMMSDVSGYDTPTGVKYYSANAHEMAHFVSHFWLRRQPRWFAEGLANYLDDANFIRDGVVRMGRWQWNGGEVDTLETMWAWDQMRESGANEGQRYSSAWAWFHFFSNKEEGRLNRWLTALRTARSPTESFEEIFPKTEWAALHKRLEAYLNEGKYRGWETRGLEAGEVSKPRELAPWEVHLIRREYFDDDTTRREEVRRAVSLAGSVTPPELTLARYEDDLRGPQQSEVLAELPSDPRAILQASYAPDLSPLHRFNLSKRAVAALPDHVGAQSRFARLALHRDTPAALAAAQKAASLAPWWDAPYYLQAEAFSLLGRCDEALAALEDVRSLIADGQPARHRRLDATVNETKQKCAEVKQ